MNKTILRQIFGKNKIIYLIIVLAIFGYQKINGSESESSSKNENIQSGQYKVVKNIDGDTIKLQDPKTKEINNIRLIGIDTPETVKPGVGVECGGREASRFTKHYAPKGSYVRVELTYIKNGEKKTDRYGRWLGYVFVKIKGKEEMLQKLLLKNGLAKEYTYQKQNYLYQKDFQILEQTATGNWERIQRQCLN